MAEFHYDQQALYEHFLAFMEGGSEGVEVTEEDLLAAFRRAKKETGYFPDIDDHSEVYYQPAFTEEQWNALREFGVYSSFVSDDIEVWTDWLNIIGDEEIEQKIKTFRGEDIPARTYIDRDYLPYTIRAHYKCSACGWTWTDDWYCAPDDECPNCDEINSPYDSDHLIEVIQDFINQ